MSIEIRGGTMSRSFRSLIKKRAVLAKTIKDLKDLSVHRVRACYRHVGPKGPKNRFFLVARGPVSRAFFRPGL